jgi:hypothetical protein
MNLTIILTKHNNRFKYKNNVNLEYKNYNNINWLKDKCLDQKY